MEQIVIRVREKEKARMLLELLAALDFVSSIQTSEVENLDEGVAASEETLDFFSFAGLGAGRDISLELIRQEAWPRQRS